MRRFIPLLLLFPALLPGCRSPYALSPEQAEAYMKAAPALVMIDVRPPEYYEKARITGALNLPLKELEERADEIPAGRPVLMYCQTGRSVRKAFALVRKKRPDLTEIYYIDGTPSFK